MNLNFKTFNRSPARVFLAVMPVLEFTSGTQSALSYAVVISAGLALTSVFFTLFHFCFPPRILKTAYLMWLAVLAQVYFHLGGIHPFWIISMALLMPDEIFKSGAVWHGFKRGLFRGLFFICLMIYIGAAREVFAGRFWVWSFYLPAGCFLLLAFASFMWQNQPGHAERYREKQEAA